MKHTPKPTRPGETIVFSDHPEFTPNLTPRQIFRLGSFGGTYWRNIFSGVNSRDYSDQHLEFSAYRTTDFDENGKPYDCTWWEGIPAEMLSSSDCNLARNKYKVHSGTSLAYWESKGWINAQDPYGWVQWYCRFYSGRRSADDERQIARWLAFAGPMGRFRKRLETMCKRAGKKKTDSSVSPVIRQGLQHWGFILS
jgi:hypothetical protein